VKETKLLTRRVGRYDPVDLKAYEAGGGLEGIKRALAMKPEEIIEQVKRSGLTGRGGAGFPTGLKWRSAAEQKAPRKYLICNADEGELGTFKDKVLLDGDPWSVLEGIVIAAYAVGVEQAYIYIKGEYEDTFVLWEKITGEARKAKLLGTDILGSKFSLDLQVARGRGLYIAGEEFALIASLEMRRPMSSLKPPYPTQQGLFGMPTVINNVETLANVPVVLAKGPEEYRRLGTEDDPGTRLFSLSGDVKQPGVYEIEMGSGTLRQLIVELGKGTCDEVAIKAVQPGGGTSALLPENLLDCALTTKAIQKAGSSIGTAAVIVYDRRKNAVEIVKGLLDYYGAESCGRCAPCRIGVVKMKEIIDALSCGKGAGQDPARLREIGNACVAASTCGMGQAFPLPVLSALELFGEDFEGKKTPCSAGS